MPWMLHSSPQVKMYVGRPSGRAGYSVYMPYDDDVQNDPAQIKARDLEAIRSSDAVVLEIDETSLGVAQELGAARAIGRPVVLITDSERVILHNCVRGDRGITVCRTKEEAIAALKSPRLSMLSS